MSEAPDAFIVSDALWARCAPLIAQHDPELLASGRRLLGLLIQAALVDAAEDEVVGYWLSVQAIRLRWQRLGLLQALSEALLLRLDGG